MGEPNELVLADGTRIDVLTGAHTKQRPAVIAVPSAIEAQKIVTETRRKLSDLPALPAQMNFIGAVICYTLFGLSDEEIAIATKASLDQITRVKQRPEYDDMYGKMVGAVLQAETAAVRDYIVKQSRDAAQKMVGHMYSENEMTAFMAAKDVLDRAGHRPADFISEHRSKVEAGLTIRFVKEDDSDMPPVLDMKPVEVDGGSDGV